MVDQTPDLAYALAAVADTLRRGEQTHEPGEWRRRSIRDHLHHASAHIVRYRNGDCREDHLAHAATRLLMALELRECSRTGGG